MGLSKREFISTVAFLGLTVDLSSAKADNNHKGDKISELIGKKLRVITPGTAQTQDFSPDRVNITIDDKGIIKDVSWG